MSPAGEGSKTPENPSNPGPGPERALTGRAAPKRPAGGIEGQNVLPSV